jgi:hypothetical protein
MIVAFATDLHAHASVGMAPNLVPSISADGGEMFFEKIGEVAAFEIGR